MSTLKTTNLQHGSAASPAIVLASDGTATAQLSSLNGGALAGMRNLLINGGMNVWQRGTTQTTSGYGSADRWNMTVSGTCTFAQETSVIPSGAQYAVKWTTGASSSYGQVRQYIEQLTVIPLRGQTLTASAYVRSGGTFSGNVLFEIGYNTSTDTYNSGVGWTLVTTTTSGTVNSSNYTQIKTTFTVPSNAVGLYVAIVPDAVQASGAIVYQSLVQLEAGTVATPFERRSYGQELALCQRYYQQDGVDATTSLNPWVPDVNNTTARAQLYVFPVQMRAAATITVTGNISWSASQIKVSSFWISGSVALSGDTGSIYKITASAEL